MTMKTDRYSVSKFALISLFLCATIGCHRGNTAGEPVKGTSSELETRKKEIESIAECQPGSGLEGCSKKLIEGSVIGDVKDLPVEGETASLFDHQRSDDQRVYEGTCLIRLAHKDGRISKFEVAIVEKIGDQPTKL